MTPQFVAGLVVAFVLFGCGLALIAYTGYRRVLRRAKGIERGLKMVPVMIHLPPPSDDTQAGSKPVQDIMREKIAQAEVLYNLIAGTATKGFKSKFYGQRHIALEIVVSDGIIHFYTAVPVAMVELVEQAIVTAYPGARVEEAEDHNIFNDQSRLPGTVGGELVLKTESAYPIATFHQLERDPMEALMNALSTLQKDEGVGVQIMIRPATTKWTKRSIKLARLKSKRSHGLGITPADLAVAAVKTPDQRKQELKDTPLSNLETGVIDAIENKTKEPGFEVLIRVLASASNHQRAEAILQSVANAYSLFDAPGLNGFKFINARNVGGLVTAFIFRFFPPEAKWMILNSQELATVYHLPDAQFTSTAAVQRQYSKQVDGPISLPMQGLLFGYNHFRDTKKEIRLSADDRRRHTYIVGQTGTGKSSLLENLIVQDMLAGNGFAFIDPHGDTAEKILGMVPKSRAEDIIYFNPGDTEYPLGLNLFEFDSPEQKDFLIQEAIGMLYKLYDPGHTGIIGPRYEHWFRNAALTLMSDPEGATFIEIPKVFTDSGFLKQKFKYLTDPTVVDFWTKEMAQTSDYHKSEMLGWFVSKFGAFMSNEMMRNIIGQTKSSFNLRQVMDEKKILIVNLSKGRVGELNSQLLGMIFVIKFQAAAMSRANVPEAQRPDFCLYVDEFQNFSTDSFASILSEARKYRLNLVVANQFIGQLTPEIRDAVFGNVGSVLSFRTGPEDAEFLAKQFAPVFEARDLINLPNFQAVMRLMVGGLPSQPFSLETLKWLANSHAELGLAIKQLSAAKYGHPRGVVESQILGRLQAPPAPRPAMAAGQAQIVARPAAGVQPPVQPSYPAPQNPTSPPPVPAVPATPPTAMLPAEPRPVMTPVTPTAAVAAVTGANPPAPAAHDTLTVQTITKGMQPAPVAAASPVTLSEPSPAAAAQPVTPPPLPPASSPPPEVRQPQAPIADQPPPPTPQSLPRPAAAPVEAAQPTAMPAAPIQPVEPSEAKSAQSTPPVAKPAPAPSKPEPPALVAVPELLELPEPKPPKPSSAVVKPVAEAVPPLAQPIIPKVTLPAQTHASKPAPALDKPAAAPSPGVAPAAEPKQASGPISGKREAKTHVPESAKVPQPTPAAAEPPQPIKPAENNADKNQQLKNKLADSSPKPQVQIAAEPVTKAQSTQAAVDSPAVSRHNTKLELAKTASEEEKVVDPIVETQPKSLNTINSGAGSFSGSFTRVIQPEPGFDPSKPNVSAEVLAAAEREAAQPMQPQAAIVPTTEAAKLPDSAASTAEVPKPPVKPKPRLEPTAVTPTPPSASAPSMPSKSAPPRSASAPKPIAAPPVTPSASEAVQTPIVAPSNTTSPVEPSISPPPVKLPPPQPTKHHEGILEAVEKALGIIPKAQQPIKAQVLAVPSTEAVEETPVKSSTPQATEAFTPTPAPEKAAAMASPSKNIDTPKPKVKADKKAAAAPSQTIIQPDTQVKPGELIMPQAGKAEEQPVKSHDKLKVEEIKTQLRPGEIYVTSDGSVIQGE